MLFKKYPSIENHYRTKYITMFMEHDLQNTTFVLQEKIDGANFQLYVMPDGTHHFGKRSSALGEDADFYAFHTIDFEPLIQRVRSKFRPGVTVILYGELFGGNVQKRISYQLDKAFLVYDVATINEDEEFGWLFPAALEEICGEYAVPTLDTIVGINEALKFNVEGVATEVGDPEYNPYDNKGIEGVVIKPRNKIILDRNDSPFSLKLKAESFNDKMKVKTKKPVAEMSVDGMTLMMEYQGYLNKNRVADYMGKEGEIETPKQMGEYIKGISADALSDFLKDHPEFNELDDKEQKRIKSVAGKCIAPLLREYL